jgi:hypothetical protein
MKNTPISKKFHDYFRSFFNQVKRPIKKNFVELSKGLVLGETVVMSEVIRKTTEKLCVRKGVERLGRLLDNIDSKELSKYMLASKHFKNIHEKTIIAIDNTDTVKEYAKCIEGMSTVHDGSSGETKNGFEIFGSSYIDDDGKAHMLQFELFSREVEEYKSDYKEWEKNMKSLLKNIHPDAGIFVMDCGYDGMQYYEYLMKNGKDFVIRANDRRSNPRKVYSQNFQEKWDIDALCYSEPKKVQTQIRNKKTGKMEDVTVRLSKAKIKLTENGTSLSIVKVQRVKRGSQTRCMYIMTTLKTSGVSQMLHVYETYLRRWKIEELFRSIKQHFHIERIQLRTLVRIQALYRIIAILHNFLITLVAWSNSMKNLIFYSAKKLQQKTQKLSLFTAIFTITQKEWSYWQSNLHSMFFRRGNPTQKQSQLCIFNDNSLFNV